MEHASPLDVEYITETHDSTSFEDFSAGVARRTSAATSRVNTGDIFEDASDIQDLFHRAHCPPNCQSVHNLFSGESFPAYEVHKLTRSYSYGAGNEIPRDLEERLRRGLLMSNQCDAGVWLLRDLVTEIIKQGTLMNNI